MQLHEVRVYPSAEPLPREEQLAWKLAALATDPVAVEPEVAEMVANRVIDNASVAIAAVNRPPVAHARAQALAHPRSADQNGACLFGIENSRRFDAEWAAWANGTAVRELDMHDTFLAADYSHPGDNIPPLLAVAQQCGATGEALVRGLVAAYEIQVALVKAICLHKHKKDHIAHLCPAQAAGIGAMLGLPTETVYQAVQQAVHVSFSTRQSRKGEISSWKAYAPAHSGKLAIEAVDRAMRGEASPSPVYEGEDSVLAYMLDGAEANYSVPLPESGEPRRAILETYTKEHSAEYQAQAIIDLAFRMREKVSDWSAVEKITLHTSHHTHYVIGTGSGDPQKFDPHASRETLDHSIMYILAVALQDGAWHHVESYLPERAGRPDTVELWKKIETVEDPSWTERYHTSDPKEKAFGGRVEIQLAGGEILTDEMAVANAHCYGEKPFARREYVHKFGTLTDGLINQDERNRFVGLCERLTELTAKEVTQLNVQLDPNSMTHTQRDTEGIF
ncbi:MmgE/PrpD family protein [Adhaeretor mobilis]|uniref:2-methylcitrate dehydratase n=1 Tax=Adhaeretor mobilis TaxID=1930276 RepID=A0A517MQT5_9BACT|nr:MmgE/PrpD family protein [Adhaeretor mobilis]QDS97241.1 2-methylcitrate dehydratase [Adhaeretor mobilis]